MWKLFGIDVNNSRQNGSTFDFEKTSVLQHQIQQETYVSKQNIVIVTKVCKLTWLQCTLIFEETNFNNNSLKF